VPWLFDDEAVDVMRSFTKLKNSLMPYLYGAAVEAHERGIPVMRAMCLEFPEDPGCAHLDLQYMLGASLLVAPIFSESGSVSYYVPEGRWTSLLTGEVVEGPRWCQESHSYASLPLLVRPNSVIAVGATDGRPDYDFPNGLTLRAYAIQDGTRIRTAVSSPDGRAGSTFEVSRDGLLLTVVPSDGTPNWRLLLVGVSRAAASGGTVSTTPLGSLVIPETPGAVIVVQLPSDR
jgi:alpha-D-xyloside xylohydrolase